MSFADRLRTLRGKRTQKEVAEALGVKHGSYTNWENGREPNYDILIKIANYYNVTVDYLIGNSDYANQKREQIGDFLGLSENAMRGIYLLKEGSQDDCRYIDALNYLLEPDYPNENTLVEAGMLRMSMILDIIAGTERDEYWRYISEDTPASMRFWMDSLCRNGLIALDTEFLKKSLYKWREDFLLSTGQRTLPPLETEPPEIPPYPFDD